MRFDAAMAVETRHLGDAAQIAAAAEQLGFDALWTTETQHNPFMPLVLAAEHTSRIQLGTAVAIAFPRSPMVTAQIAWDLQAQSKGRFLLGLGTQVRAHIERRFGMAWDAPVARLRDYIHALRAIWHSWQTGERLNHRGPYYYHTLMTPFFNPGPIDHPDIPIYIAGVNEGLAKLAGECCNGFHVHPFHSVDYINQVVRPAVAEGAAHANRSVDDVVFASSIFVITGATDKDREQMRDSVRSQIAFYASTPTYRAVLNCHGWGEIGDKLGQLAAQQRWGDMGSLISDEMLAAYAVEAAPDQLGAALRQRYTGVLDRVALYLPYVPGTMDQQWQLVAQQIKA